MDVAALEVGRTYYEVLFVDMSNTVPSVRPLVYIGVNLFEGDTAPDTFYFQDAVSYIVLGSAEAPHAVAPEKEADILVFPFKAGEMAQLFELSELVEQIKETEERARALGYPKLQRCTGKWR